MVNIMVLFVTLGIMTLRKIAVKIMGIFLTLGIMTLSQITVYIKDRIVTFGIMTLSVIALLNHGQHNVPICDTGHIDTQDNDTAKLQPI